MRAAFFTFAAMLLFAGLPLADSVCMQNASSLTDAQKPYKIGYSYECPSGVLSVAVQDSGGTPAAGVRIVLLDQSPPYQNETYATADSSGAASFQISEGGNYFVFAFSYGHCPGDGRALPTLPSCKQTPPNESSAPAASNQSSSPSSENQSAWVSPNSLVGHARNFTLIQDVKQKPASNPGEETARQSLDASAAISSAQKSISEASALSGGRMTENITIALSFLGDAQRAYIAENYLLAKNLSQKASDLLKQKAAKLPAKPASAGGQVAVSGGLFGLDLSSQETLFAVIAILGAIAILWGIYHLIPKGPLD